MTTQFDISALGLTVTEGGVYSFTLTPKAALGSDTVIRWEIVPKGELPISSSDFSALSGVVNFASGAVDAQTVTITPSDDSVLEVLKHFEIRVYEVVGDRDDTTTETDDILIGSQDVTLSDDETDDYGSSRLSSTGEANILTAANTQDLTTSGGGGDDIYIITRFQHGDVSISDTFGTNLVKFDAGVTITDYSETSVSFFGNVSILSVSLTLSTGAEVMIDAPLSFSFQLGDGETLSYADFKTAIGASGTNATSALAADYAVTTQTSVPDISGNTEDAPTQRLVSTGEADVLGAGGDFSFTASGGGGDDTYIITRFQHGDVSISDTFGTNLVKFDAGVTITDYSETSVSFFGNVSILSVSLTLSTGAEVMIDAPLPFSFQLGDGEVLSYADFKMVIGASGTAGSSALAADYTVTAPQTPTEEPEVNNAPVVATAIADQTATEDTAFSLDISSVFADADGDTLTYSISGNPSWLSFDADTGVFSGTPAQSDTGTYTVTVTATDPEGEAVTDTFDITVENTDNNAPVFEGVETVHSVIVSGVEFIYIGDTVPDGFFLNINYNSSTIYSIEPTTKNGNTGLRLWTDGATRQQIVDIVNQDATTINGNTVTDSRTDLLIRARLVDSATGDVEFSRISSAQGTDYFFTEHIISPEITLDENSDTNTVVFTATATDPDNLAGQTPTDTITYELVAGAGDSDFFTIDETTGEVRFINTPDYETQASYVVHVKAVSTSTLGTGSTTETTAQYTVNLNNLNDNGPEFTDNVEPYGLTLGGIRFIYTGHDAAEAASFSMRFKLNTNLVLHDIDPLTSGVLIHVSKTDLTQQQIVDLVNANFAARGIPGHTDRRSGAERNLLRAELVDPSTGGDALDYTALFGGTSHLSEATHNFVKQLPSITIDENTETYEVVFTAQATDADNVAGQTPTDTITYDLVLGAGDNSYFTIDRTTGEVRFKDTPDYETKASYEVHVVAHSPSTLGAGSGGAIPQETTKQYIVRLNDTDDPPVFDVENTAGATEIDYEYSLVIQGVRLTYVGDSDQVDQNFVFDISRNFDFRTFIIDISGSSLILQARTFSADMTLQEFVNLINLGTTITGPGGTDDQRSSAESGLVHAEVIDPSKADVLFDFVAAVNNPGRRFPEGRKSYAFGQDKIVVVKEAVTLDENSDVANVLFTPTATDINTGDTIHYELVGVGKHDNDFFTIDRDTGAVRFAATPDYETQSSYEVYVKAVSTTTAGSTTESVIKYVVELNDVNDAPVFANPLDTQTVTSGQPFSFTVEAATDDEGDSITYEATQADGTDLPSWLSFDVDTRTFSGTPPRKASTDLTIRITATDSNGAVGTQDFELKLDRAPIFDIERQAGKTADVEGADYVEAVDVISWDENDTDVLLTATATDINVGDVIHYELDNSITGNDNSFFTIDRDTGAVRFTADPDYETQTSYELYVKAVSTNEAGGTTQSTIKYTVELNNLDDNAPEFDSEYSVTVAGIKFTYLGDGVPDFSIHATHSRGTTGWSAFVDGNGNPSIFYDSFTPTRNLTLQHIIDVTSGDADFSALVRAELAVPDTGSNRLDYDEFFGGTGYRVTKTHSFTQESITWVENSALEDIVFTATAEDADNIAGQTPTETISYALVDGAGDNSFFSIDSATGDVRFLATPDYETQASYVVHVKAISTSTIGTGSTQETIRQYTVNLSDAVRQINVHGLLFKTTNEQAVDISFELTSLSSITTYDLATNRLTLKFNGTPTLNSIISHLSSTTDFRTNGWTVELAAGADGTTRLNFNDDDNDPATIEVKDTVYTLPAFGATPEPPNNAPTVATEIPDQTASEGTDFTFTFDEAAFADADGDTLTYTAALADGSDLPDWLTFDADTRTFSSTRTLTQSDAGTLSITVTATDPDGEAVTDTFTLTVENIDNNAPVFTNADDFSVTVAGIKFTYEGADVSQVDSFPLNVGYVNNGATSQHGISYSSHNAGSVIAVTSHTNLTLQDIVDLINANAAAANFAGYRDSRTAEQKALIRAELVDPSTGGTALDYDAFFGTQSVGLITQTFESSHVITKTFTAWDENSDAADVVFTATAEDADNIAGQTPTDIITYELVTGMGDNDFFTIDANTGEVRFAATPDYETQSGYTLHIKATSTSTLGGGSTQETTARYWVNLNNLNDNTPIVATEIADQTASEGTAFSFAFDADAFTDADGDTLTYSVAGNPSWLTFDADTRTFAGTPPEGSQGTVSVTVTASDGTNTVTDTFDIEIAAAEPEAREVNIHGLVFSTTNEIMAELHFSSGSYSVSFSSVSGRLVVGVDSNAGLSDTLNDIVTSLNNQFSSKSINGVTVRLADDADGTHKLNFGADDNDPTTIEVASTSSKHSFPTDRSSEELDTPREINIHGLLFKTTNAGAADIKFVSDSSNSFLFYNSHTGQLAIVMPYVRTLNEIISFVAGEADFTDNHFTVELADGADGGTRFNFRDDDGNADTIEIGNTVHTIPAAGAEPPAEPPAAPSDDNAPVFETSADSMAAYSVVIQGIEFAYTGDNYPATGFFVLFDSNSSSWVVQDSTKDGQQGVTFFMLSNISRQQVIDIINGDLTGTLNSDPIVDRRANPQLITARLVELGTGDQAFTSDSHDTAHQFVANPPTISWDENTDASEIVFTATATDADNIAGQTPTDTITYELVSGMGDNSYFTIDAATGAVRFAASPDYETKASYEVHVKAISTSTLGTGSTKEATAQYTVQLNNLNDNAPTVATAIPDQEATEGTEFILTFDAGVFADADNDPLSYSATLADGSALSTSWLSFDADTRTFSGTPPEGSEGTVSVTVTASDGTNTVTDTFDIEIAAAGNTRPTVTETAVTIEVARGATLALTDLADDIGWSDPDPDDSVFSYFKLDFSDPILGGRFYLDDEQKTAAELEALTSGAVEFRAGNKNGAPFSFTLQVGDGGDSGTDATDLLAPITITIDVL